MTAARLPILIAALAPLASAFAQTYDVLDGAARTALYVQTDYTGNDNRSDCDWFLSGDELLAGSVDGRGCRVILRLSGTINRAGAAYFRQVAERLAANDHAPALIVLDSRGGDTDAAIYIGRTIRSMDVFQRVAGGIEARIAAGDQAVCFSGCIVIFAAAYRRQAEFDIYGNPDLPSRLGIHSPGQFDREQRRYDSSAENPDVQRTAVRMKQYFESVDVDPAIVDDMFDVPFEEIRLLTEAELRDYRLLP